MNARLFDAIVHGGPAEVQAALDAGASVNARNEHTWTPAIAAVARGNVEALRLLVSKGADIHVVTRTGMNALRYAGFAGCTACVPFLVSWGADPAAQDADGWGALHFAAMTGHDETVRALVAAKAPVNSKTGAGDTPLHLAVANANGKTVQALLEGGADPMLENELGISPLRSASFREEQEAHLIIQEFLKTRRS